MRCCLSLNEEGKESEKGWFELPKQNFSRENLFSKCLAYLFPRRNTTFSSDLDIPYRAHSIGWAFMQFGGRGVSLKLEDLGIRIQSDPQGFLDLHSERMIIEQAIEEEIYRENANNIRSSPGIPLQMYLTGHAQPIFTYLANTIADNGREIPYSTITAIDFTSIRRSVRFFRRKENRCRRSAKMKSP